MVKVNSVKRTRGKKKLKSREVSKQKNLGNMGSSAQGWGLRIGGGVIILVAAFWLGWSAGSNKRDHGDATVRLEVDRSHFIELPTPTEPPSLLPRQEEHKLKVDGDDGGPSTDEIGDD